MMLIKSFELTRILSHNLSFKKTRWSRYCRLQTMRRPVRYKD